MINDLIDYTSKKKKKNLNKKLNTLKTDDSKQNISLVNSLANLYVKNKITLKQAKSELQEKDIDSLNKAIMKMRIKK